MNTIFEKRSAGGFFICRGVNNKIGWIVLNEKIQRWECYRLDGKRIGIVKDKYKAASTVVTEWTKRKQNEPE